MAVKFNRYKNGTTRALTFSYDDGHKHDRKLVEIFNRYGMHATFHLNSRNIVNHGQWLLEPQEIGELFVGHEVSCHMPTHPHVTRIPHTALAAEILDDRRNLEQLCGYVVRGMSYPYGTYSKAAEEILRTCGIEYSRTTVATEWFAPPDNFLEWNPTCHHAHPKLHELFERFAGPAPYAPLQVMNVWGHSFEFDMNNNWSIIEDFCKLASGREDIWYATNIEICDYLNALRALRVSADCRIIYNPTAIDIWVTAEDKPCKIAAGETVTFEKGM